MDGQTLAVSLFFFFLSCFRSSSSSRFPLFALRFGMFDFLLGRANADYSFDCRWLRDAAAMALRGTWAFDYTHYYATP